MAAATPTIPISPSPLMAEWIDDIVPLVDEKNLDSERRRSTVTDIQLIFAFMMRPYFVIDERFPLVQRHSDAATNNTADDLMLAVHIIVCQNASGPRPRGDGVTDHAELFSHLHSSAKTAELSVVAHVAVIVQSWWNFPARCGHRAMPHRVGNRHRERWVPLAHELCRRRRLLVRARFEAANSASAVPANSSYTDRVGCLSRSRSTRAAIQIRLRPAIAAMSSRRA